MRKYLLPEKGQFYKANLHCHSTVSDGKWTPEEIKKNYVEKGYSVVAYTDHNVMIDHSELTDENFLALRGYELDVGQKEPEFPNASKKTCHMCFVALEPDNDRQVCWHREKHFGGNAKNYRHLAKFDESLPDYERVYSGEGVSDMMRIGRENGFFVTYNHPAWSLETSREYTNYEGMHAMEICNYGCYEEGYEDYVPMAYDEILRSGKRIYCISTDDNHNRGDEPAHDSFGGFTMIKAEKLEYRTITSAMERGDFYASMGPEIYELYYEDGKVTVKCSEAADISICFGVRRARKCYNSDGTPLTEATFEVREDSIYFRITVTDPQGRHANTRAYFLDELQD